MSDPADLPATVMRAGYRDRTLSPVEVIDAVLARIERWEPHINALYAGYAEQARAEAVASADRWQRGEPAGPLDGIPLTLKENIVTAGCPTPFGTAGSDLTPAAANSPTADRVHEAAGILVGKTTMPDYGMSSSGQSSIHGVTRNPWNLALNPGGSSSGAAAAAAAGYGPIHYGTDIGGSIRLPAGWCGVVGFKPSFGLIPVVPPYLGRTIGPLTRTVADAALATSAAAIPDRRDHTAGPELATDWAAASRPLALSGLRIGLMTDAGAGFPVEPAVSAAVGAVAELLQSLGAHVEKVEPIMTDDMLAGLNDFWCMRQWSEIRGLPAARKEKIAPFIHDWTADAENLTGAAVFAGYSQFDTMAFAADRRLDTVDFLITPTSPVTTWPVEQIVPDNDPTLPFKHVCFTIPFNPAGHPAVSMNCGRVADGTAIGVQFVGRRFDDVRLLQLAAAFEEARPAQAPWPSAPPVSP
ncbi:amidase [Nocardia sp. NPDC051756]|uniref:amidase n=1 Tax=Nocardia sp. NPDC051756 TaxID=3154751 RepID=UPI003420A00E